MEEKGKKGKESTQKIEYSEEQVEMFARRVMPLIKRYFADENVKKEFEEWKRKRQVSRR